MERDTIVILLDSSQLGGIESHVYHLSRALKNKAGLLKYGSIKNIHNHTH